MKELQELGEIFDFGIKVAKGIADFERSTLDISEVKHRRQLEIMKEQRKANRPKRRKRIRKSK